ncbi:Der GTPase-activating protein YihI [Glaciecola sp. KUL10]|uniref:Der GTPase-activating protein YihI n=1 Tax=Glaciecola sp. (strain KUL10) TaxID=2161813 RepID=UPI000D789538|nr:Der GTPase-activating protein YihI [Glaciecola sp. KUL10]GBL06247.1 hypothetical protein KUL10_35860 [Glaciecola sp. KUL10]
MGRKKSRKVGLIGVRKTDAPRVKKEARKPKKTKGNVAGSRQTVAEQTTEQAQKQKRDPRIGSKKPIDLKRHLIKEAPKPVVKPRFNTPRQELNAIEDDQKLQDLLDRQETKALTKAESDYVSTQLARHKVLCDLLGISIEENDDDNDPLDDFDAITIDDYKD